MAEVLSVARSHLLLTFKCFADAQLFAEFASKWDSSNGKAIMCKAYTARSCLARHASYATQDFFDKESTGMYGPKLAKCLSHLDIKCARALPAALGVDDAISPKCISSFDRSAPSQQTYQQIDFLSLIPHGTCKIHAQLQVPIRSLTQPGIEFDLHPMLPMQGCRSHVTSRIYPRIHSAKPISICQKRSQRVSGNLRDRDRAGRGGEGDLEMLELKVSLDGSFLGEILDPMTREPLR
jgi:hypothetical protein